MVALPYLRKGAVFNKVGHVPFQVEETTKSQPTVQHNEALTDNNKAFSKTTLISQ